MRNIWIDGYEANVVQRVGSGQVAVELLRSLEKIDNLNNYTVALPGLPLLDLPLARNGWIYKVLKPRKLWTLFTLPIALKLAKPKVDVVFSPTHYIPRFTSVKRVVMIFDLAYLYYPQMFLSKDLYKLKNWTRYSIENSNHIITISKSTKRDILKYYKIESNKVTVAYPGYDKTIFKQLEQKELISEILKKYQVDGTYIIYIGTIQPRKNLIRLMEAIKSIPEIKLVVVGKTRGLGRQAWMFEETIKYPKKIGIEDRVIFTGFVPSEDLPYLLSGSLAYVLPSLYEGFGIPVVEAMACGVPVIVSQVSSLPEVVGKAGLLVDPDSTDQINQSIRSLLSDSKLRARLSKLGLKQAEKFSWFNMAKTVKQVLEDV